MKETDLSVIMATCNGERFLAEQLDSILLQQPAPAEIIVGDDASTDGTAEILKHYADRGLISWQPNPERLGVIANFKSVAARATAGNYIAFADQDDIWLPDKLKLSLTHLQAIETPGIPCMVYSDPCVIDANGKLIKDSLWEILGFNQYKHTLETVIFGNPAGGLTMLINPALAECIPGIPDNCYMHDAWLTLCAYTFGRAGIVDQPLVQYRQHENNVTFSTAYKTKSRLKRIFSEVVNATKGKNGLFSEQFVFVRQFYEVFRNKIDPSEQLIFERFLNLEKQSYLAKKIAFRKAASITNA